MDHALDSETFSEEASEEESSPADSGAQRQSRHARSSQSGSLQRKLGAPTKAQGKRLEAQVHPKERLQVRFLCLVFMNKDLLVTGGSNGFLYIFKKGVLIEEQIGHLKSPILCIDKSQFHENFFVTGGQDGSVNLWEIRNYQDSNVIEKLFEYNIYKDGKGLYDNLSLGAECRQLGAKKTPADPSGPSRT